MAHRSQRFNSPGVLTGTRQEMQEKTVYIYDTPALWCGLHVDFRGRHDRPHFLFLPRGFYLLISDDLLATVKVKSKLIIKLGNLVEAKSH